MLYDYLDSQDFYKTVAAKDSRSRMNVTFRTGNDVQTQALPGSPWQPACPT